MNRLSIASVRDIFETAFEFLSSRSPSTAASIDYNLLPDPRVRLIATRFENEAQFDTKSVQTDGDGVDVGEIHSWEEGSQLRSDNLSIFELESPSREIARLRSELKLLQDKHRALQVSLQGAQSQSRQKDIFIDELQQRNEKLERDLRESQRLAEERRIEVKSMEQFLSRTDTWAGSDMVQCVKDMNTEILQFSAAASETFTDCDETVDSPGRTKALEKVGTRFGPKMRQILEERDHTEDPSLLQYALQSCICMHISHSLSSFCFGLPGRFDSQLSKIHRHMHETGAYKDLPCFFRVVNSKTLAELQPTSARWRALTHHHIYELTPNVGKTAIDDVTDSTKRGVANILAAAGLGEVEEHVVALESDFESNLRRIASSASRISKVIRECTVSTEFRVMFVEPGKDFNPATMEDLYDGLVGQSSGRVLCTTEIGLHCLTNVRKDEMDGNNIERKIVLKPRVLLESVVQLLDEE